MTIHQGFITIQCNSCDNKLETDTHDTNSEEFHKVFTRSAWIQDDDGNHFCTFGCQNNFYSYIVSKNRLIEFERILIGLQTDLCRFNLNKSAESIQTAIDNIREELKGYTNVK